MSKRIAKALVSKGMFPRDLPPIFDTSDVGKKFNALDVLIKKSKRTKPERYSLPKAKLGRRTSYVVNPIPYFLLAREISENWEIIRAHLKRSKISAHTPAFFGASRALRDIDFKKIRERKIVDGSGHSYVLTTDYARFFPTIYTHSIAWALHTKAVAKSKPKDLTLTGNALDLYVMQMQEGQTAGIPIGPDASYILAEIVSSAIDIEYAASVSVKSYGLRYVDDFTLFFSSRAEAETALSKLAQAAGEYQIELNPEKTSILGLTEEASEAWIFALSAFSISDREWGQRDSLAKLTELCISLFAKHSDASIGKYAIKKISSFVISTKHIDFAVACVLRLCAISPAAYPDAVSFVTSYCRAGYQVDLRPVARFIENNLKNGLGLSHDLEVCWSLWLAYELKIKLGAQSHELLKAAKSSIVIVLAKLVSDAGLLRGGEFVPLMALNPPAQSSFEREAWLLYYEGCRRGWFGWTDTQLKDSLLSDLYSNQVSFINLAAKTPGVLEPRSGGTDISKDVVRNASWEKLKELFTSQPVHSGYGMIAREDDQDDDDESDADDEDF